MLEQTSKLLQLMIKEGKTCNKISPELNISNRYFYNRLTTLKIKFYSLKEILF